VSPSIVKVVYVEDDESMRQERLSDRVADEHAVWEFEKHPTEQQVKMDLRKHADLIVDTGRELDQLASEVVAWIRAL
jgi:dephospho-CoA kinase